MAKSKPVSNLVNIAAWITGILVSLAVGFSMTGSGVLNQSIPLISALGNGIIVAIAGWLVVILTIISVILAIANKL